MTRPVDLGRHTVALRNAAVEQLLREHRPVSVESLAARAELLARGRVRPPAATPPFPRPPEPARTERTDP